MDISNNLLNGFQNRGMDILGPAIAASKIKRLNIAGNLLEQNGGVDAVVSMLANAGALASLDLSQNDIPAEEMGPIERLCESKQIALRK